MSGTQQPEALRLADKYEIEGFLQDHRFAKDHWCRQAATELRRQHARITELEDAADIAIERIEELEKQLSAIGAGGVEPLRKQAAVPQGWKLVQIELLERIQESLGSYLSDHGWSQSDMDAADALDGFLAAVPQPPACNQSMQPELATYSAQARNKKGIEQ